MKSIGPAVLLSMCILTTGLLVSPAQAQLYGNKADATTGDLNDQDYWWSKYDDMMMDRAVKTKQPEGRIAVSLASHIRRLDELSKKYPKHDGIKQMKEHAANVEKSLDSNANRGASFSPEVPWEEANFAQIWVNMHWAKMSFDEKDYHNVESLMQNVHQNLDIMLAPDRMKSYPADLKKFVEDAKPEADRLAKLATEKLTTKSGPEVTSDTSITKGDLNNQDYWWAKFDDMMLNVALEHRAPEGRIGYNLVGTIKRVDDLLKKYPNHEGLKEMKKHAEDIFAKIDPKANRNISFSAEVPWEESNFAQLWVNLHHAQFAHTQKDDKTAAMLLSNIRQNQEILLKPDRLKEYPSELRDWVVGSKAEYETLAAAVKKK